MSENQPWIREEMRMLGAIQIMTGLIVHALGIIWIRLLISQITLFGKTYIPLVAITGYPFWSSLFFIASGAFAVAVEKKHSKCLMTYTLGANIFSACLAVIGMLLISLELVLFRVHSRYSVWPHKSGRMLSQYLLIFTFLELFVASTVTHWICKARQQR